MARFKDLDYFTWSDSDLDLDELFERDYTDKENCCDKPSVDVDKKDIYVYTN